MSLQKQKKHKSKNSETILDLETEITFFLEDESQQINMQLHTYHSVVLDVGGSKNAITCAL